MPRKLTSCGVFTEERTEPESKGSTTTQSSEDDCPDTTFGKINQKRNSPHSDSTHMEFKTRRTDPQHQMLGWGLPLGGKEWLGGARGGSWGANHGPYLHLMLPCLVCESPVSPLLGRVHLSVPTSHVRGSSGVGACKGTENSRTRVPHGAESSRVERTFLLLPGRPR